MRAQRELIMIINITKTNYGRSTLEYDNAPGYDNYSAVYHVVSTSYSS